MSRSGLPPPDGSTHTFVRDAIALSFFVACVAATLALVSSMCSACGRKPKTAAASSDSGKSAGADSVSDDGKQAAGEEEVVTLSPELATHGPIAPVALPSSTSKRLLSMNLSKKLSMNIPDKLRLSRRERKEHKAESEDTLWKKGIILGEKCKIPGERDGEASDAADPADELAAENFRRSSYSRPISRSSSCAMDHQNDTPPRVSHS